MLLRVQQLRAENKLGDSFPPGTFSVGRTFKGASKMSFII